MDRWAWTSEDSGSGKGTTYIMGGLPADCKLIDDPPVPAVGCDYNMRYWFDEPNNTWVLLDTAMPHERPSDFYAWDWSERYDVDPSDPLRNSWVLKPDAQPVEQPEEGGE